MWKQNENDEHLLYLNDGCWWIVEPCVRWDGSPCVDGYKWTAHFDTSSGHTYHIGVYRLLDEAKRWCEENRKELTAR